MKKSGFQTKYSFLKRNSSLKKRSSLKKFREVVGENENVLQVNEADMQFSIQIRKRDSQCVNCGSTLFLGCSHYFGRGIYATRYDPENADALCQMCHEIWEHEKEGIYKQYMICKLGQEKFNALQEKSKTIVSPYFAITEFMKLSESLQDNDIEY